jgi:hypothetical protein
MIGAACSAPEMYTGADMAAPPDLKPPCLTIAGTVREFVGDAPIAMVTVKALGAGAQTLGSDVSAAAGEFQFRCLPPTTTMVELAVSGTGLVETRETIMVTDLMVMRDPFALLRSTTNNWTATAGVSIASGQVHMFGGPGQSIKTGHYLGPTRMSVDPALLTTGPVGVALAGVAATAAPFTVIRH